MTHNAVERLLTETADFAGARHLVDVEGMSSGSESGFSNGLGVFGLERATEPAA